MPVPRVLPFQSHPGSFVMQQPDQGEPALAITVMGRAWTASPTCPALCRLSTLAPCPFSSLLVALRYLAFLSECSLLPQLSLLADFAYSGPCAWSALSLNSAYLDLNVIVSENLPDSLI